MHFSGGVFIMLFFTTISCVVSAGIEDETYKKSSLQKRSVGEAEVEVLVDGAKNTSGHNVEKHVRTFPNDDDDFEDASGDWEIYIESRAGPDSDSTVSIPITPSHSTTTTVYEPDACLDGSFFLCDTSACHPNSLKCDGQQQCRDGSDEIECSSSVGTPKYPKALGFSGFLCGFWASKMLGFWPNW